MKFTRIEIRRFGPLARIDSGDGTPLPNLVAVLGPNEAGKTAFHQVLGAMLYGFHPANHADHAFAPWGGGNIEIRATVQVDGGEPMQVVRRLLKTPRGEVTQGERIEKLDNRSLQPVNHIDRKVYSEVYAITLAQLAGLHDAAWETVQEQLIVGMGAQDLRSARAVAHGFREAGRKLWQPANRGKQRRRELQSELAELGRARLEAETRDKEVRRLDSQLSTLFLRLTELREERSDATQKLELTRELLPLKKRLQDLDALEERLGTRDALRDLPRDPVARDRELHDRVKRSKQRIEELSGSQEQVRLAAGSLSESELRTLGRASVLRALAAKAPLVHERIGRRGTLEREIAGLEGGLREAALPLLGLWPTGAIDPETGELSPVDWGAAGEPFRSLQMSALRKRVTVAEAERRRCEDLQDRFRRVKGRTPARTPFISRWAIFLVVVAIGVLLSGVFLEEAVVSSIGVVLLLPAGIVLVRSWSRRSAAGQLRVSGLEEQDELRQRISDAESRERDAAAAARELLLPLRLQESHLDVPSGTLVSDLSEIKDLFHLRHDRMMELGRLSDEEAALANEFDRLTPDLSLSLPEDRGLALLELGRTLQDLEERRIRVEEAGSEEGRLEAAVSEEQKEYDESSELRERFYESVKRAGEAPDASGLQRLAERLANLELHTGLRQELEKEVGELDSMRGRIREAEAAGEDWRDDPERHARDEATLEAMAAETEEITKNIGEIQERQSVLLAEDTLDLVDGQILHVQAVLRTVERERDLKLVFAHAVEEAEARFRAEHQPDLLRRAEEHLSTVTAGRYERILVGEVGDKQGFFLDAEHLPEPLPVAAPLSTSTREQVYLALRLAIVEHLDHETEPLPLLMDEVLVNWDPERRSRVLDLLEQVAPTRQIFLFTCHPHIAEEVTDRGGMLLSLTPPS